MDKQKQNAPIGIRRLILFGVISLFAGLAASEIDHWAGLCACAGVMGFCMEMYYVG